MTLELLIVDGIREWCRTDASQRHVTVVRDVTDDIADFIEGQNTTDWGRRGRGSG